MKCRMRIMQHYGIAHHSYGKSMRATNYVANPPRGTKRRPKNSKRHGKVGESRLTGRFLGKPWPNTHHGQPPNAWVVAAEQVCMPPTTLQTHYEAQNDIKTGQISPKDKEKGAAACLLLAFRGSHDPIHITDNHPSVCCSCKTSLQATHYVTNPLRGTKWHQNKGGIPCHLVGTRHGCAAHNKRWDGSVGGNSPWLHGPQQLVGWMSHNWEKSWFFRLGLGSKT